MSKVIIFSTDFPKWHRSAGKPTHFVEKMIAWYWDTHYSDKEWCSLIEVLQQVNGSKFTGQFYQSFIDKLSQKSRGYKGQTIREGHHYKVGDVFSPRIWIDKPYRSKQLAFLPDLRIVKIWDFEVTPTFEFKIGKHICNHEDILWVAISDGLNNIDFIDWFKKPFKGQIICWNENTNY